MCSSVAETPWAVASLQQDPRETWGAMGGSLAGTNTGPGAAPVGTARVRHVVDARLLSPELSINCIWSSELSWEPGKVTSPLGSAQLRPVAGSDLPEMRTGAGSGPPAAPCSHPCRGGWL